MMCNDMYSTYDDVFIEYSDPYNFNENRLDYMKSNAEPTYEVDYGDTFQIPFCIGCKYRTFIIKIVVYNNRREVVLENSESVDEDGFVYLDIDADISKNILKKGVYYCQIQAETPSNSTHEVCTLINLNECSIYIR